MNGRTLATRYRPRLYSEVVGQESQVQVLEKVVMGSWKPPSLLFSGPFGTGKTTLARLTSKALMCEERKTIEPCGECRSCLAIEAENHPGYIELDAASKGAVKDVREIRDLLEYRPTGELRILTFDESHMLSREAQNAMLEMLEEGRPGVILMFCTTETGKMLPTIRSRCIELDLKLLTPRQIADRLRYITTAEQKQFNDKAIRIISTYVRGHLRDALMLTEQLYALAAGNEVDEVMTRTYLKLDRAVDVYEFLILKDHKQQLTKVEELLCNYSVAELQEIIGESLLNAYKVKLGLGDFVDVDTKWLEKVVNTHGETLLKKAEQVLSLEADFATVTHAAVVFARVFADSSVIELQQGQEERGGILTSYKKPKTA